MATKQIVYVPGKNPKPDPALHSELLWRALVEGVRRVDRAAAGTLQASSPQFHLVGWNHLYYHVYKDITRDIPWIDALINKHGPTEQDMRDAHAWNIRLSRFVLELADHVPFLLRVLPEEVRSTAKEINRYFNDDEGVARKIRDLLKQTLRPILEQHEDVLLIAHSLGTVIAYDTLWELSHQDGIAAKVDFLTMGSPLGMHYIHRHLQGISNHGENSYPGLIRHWINFSAEGDVAALNQHLKERFQPMLDQGLADSIEDHCHGIYNYFRSDEGLNCHRSYGYLVNPAVGSVIAGWWKH